MRYAPDYKEATRARLLTVTGSLVKKQGFAATGVDALMAAAGLTSGAFYSHFGSKKALLEAIIDNELARSRKFFAAESTAEALLAVEKYLSLAHVNGPESGCALPSLSSEIARADEATRRMFENGLCQLQQQILATVRDEGKAWALIALLVGAVAVARGLVSDSARQAILDGALGQVRQMLQTGTE